MGCLFLIFALLCLDKEPGLTLVCLVLAFLFEVD